MRRSVLALAGLLCVSGPAQAQNLRDKITDLFRYGNCGELLCLDGSINAGTGHGNHFIPSAATGNFAVISFISDAVAVNASNFPLSATSSGVTFKLVGGVPVKSTNSAGPIFGERAQTLGKGRFLMGANMSGIRFKTLRGVPIDNLSLTFTHEDVGNPGLGDPTFENDVINVRMSLYVDLLVTSFFATYGLFDHVDLSVAAPVVHTSIQGRSTAQIVPFGTPAFHFFGGTSADPILRASTATFGSATGIGDVAGRIKINFSNRPGFSFAVLGDARFATGNEKDLLGAGNTSFRAMGIASAQYGSFTPHLNAGYLWRGGDLANDAFIANAGFDQALSDWATLAADVLSEWQVGKSKLVLPGPVTYTIPFTRTVDPTDIPNKKDNRADASLGFKFLTGGPTIITNALIPLIRGGLSPNVVWTLGAEFNF